MGASTDTERLAQAVRNPGRLILGPTATTGAFPYGGLNLGPHRDGEAVWRCDYVNVRDPASGRTVEINRYSVEFPEIYVNIDGVAWDEDLVLFAFSRVSRSGSLAYASPAETRIEGTTAPVGVRAMPPFLFAAEDPNHKSFYFRRPILTLSLLDGVALSRELRAGLPLSFIPTPDRDWATNGDFQISRLENIVL